jgi:hypothetical protein
MSAAIVSCYHFIAITLIIVLRLASNTKEFQLQSSPHGAWYAAWQAALCGSLTVVVLHWQPLWWQLTTALLF